MRHVPIAEFKDKMSEVIAAAEAGEDIVITRHGRRVVRLLPIGDETPEQRRTAREALLALREELRQEGVAIGTDELIAWKNEDRR